MALVAAEAATVDVHADGPAPLALAPALDFARPTRAKRAFDLTAALTLILMLSPVLALLALLVRLDGGRPLFRQRRFGRNGEWFEMIKFRSMVPDAEARLRADAALYEQFVDNGYKLPPDQDPRITRIGRFLRSSSLDELPQLFNVVRGEMSLVGPRPLLPEEPAEYFGHGPHAAAYLAARPGMTGLWQISGRSGLRYERRVELDAEYLKQCSLRRDLAILCRTVRVVLHRDGAY